MVPARRADRFSDVVAEHSDGEPIIFVVRVEPIGWPMMAPYPKGEGSAERFAGIRINRRALPTESAAANIRAVGDPSQSSCGSPSAQSPTSRPAIIARGKTTNANRMGEYRRQIGCKIADVLPTEGSIRTLRALRSQHIAQSAGNVRALFVAARSLTGRAWTTATLHSRARVRDPGC